MKRQRAVTKEDLDAIEGREETRMEIVQVSLDDLHPYANNPRKNEKAVQPVAESIRNFDFSSPILLDSEGVILAGHTRYLAAKSLGLETVPAIYVDDLTPVEARAFRLADNKVGMGTAWNLEKLKAELRALKGKFKMELFGFGEDEIKVCLDDFSVAAMTEEPLAEIEERHRVIRGQIWRLGDHVLACGEGTDGLTNEKVLGGELAQACVTRPNVLDWSRTEKLMRQALLHTTGAVYFHVKPNFLHLAKPAWEDAGGTWSTFIINKGGEEIGPVVPHSFSAWLYGWNRQRKHYFIDERNNVDVWEYKATENASENLLFCGEAIRNSTIPERIVFDPAAGLGDTLMAAEMACRKSVCVENNPEACSRILSRWENFTHREAELLKD